MWNITGAAMIAVDDGLKKHLSAAADVLSDGTHGGIVGS
jgi:hypothetical protein